MTSGLKIAIAGVAGRMGRQLANAVIDGGQIMAGASEAPGSPHVGKELGEVLGRPGLSLAVSESVEDAARKADVWIDFTAPNATLAALAALRKTNVQAVIIGTTGFDAAGEAEIAEVAGDLAIVKAGNFSLGVNLLCALTRRAAESLGEDWDIEVLETHHRRKVDAPSGTALMLGDAAARGRGADLKTLRSPPYDGPDARREPGKIGFAVRRSGDVIGEHEVTFGSDMEILSLSHTALDRAVFANGAIAAARWALRQPPGLYDMNDVLGL
ncbi:MULTISPECIES: 4-hydroxy-tetrahydrodipicolinate reductase [Henriciella]|jgi:4-hydroxy-tetrahydrodipicolinate reductase|uniref:4-hydroxy-tetrahydrodipicolinate reductase n=1 Tax=Henriciella pelagia TaxID=1977912 RepID=A0ABQ1JCZ2_9PROT|nr:4-hydroxy-tetrahydrodipicolinate reductase [Henriciella pelagia]GGB65789.1 4-hydroxy-tetrahydrodipicolinate reductase [Henriciella pelagia]